MQYKMSLTASSFILLRISWKALSGNTVSACKNNKMSPLHAFAMYSSESPTRAYCLSHRYISLQQEWYGRCSHHPLQKLIISILFHDALECFFNVELLIQGGMITAIFKRYCRLRLVSSCISPMIMKSKLLYQTKC